MPKRTKNTWKNAAVYQVYPWTFNEDTNHTPQSGHGTIRGITEKLNYLQDLGVNAIWLSPFYPSPMVDGGYDVTDYTGVTPDLGTTEDLEVLLKSARAKDIMVMVDLVPNHTSDQHEWFKKSQAGEDGKSDWYIWHDGLTDDNGEQKPPNNWSSVFSLPQLKRRQLGELGKLGEDDKTPPIPAWRWDDVRGQYYLASFAREQPDLNWSNPKVREAIKDVMRFWLDKGVDGFRVDAVNYIAKNMELTDEEPDTSYREGIDNPYDQLQRFNSCNYPEVLYDYLREVCSVLYEEPYKNRHLRLVFEAYASEDLLNQIDRIDPKVASSFNFGTLRLSWSAAPRKMQLDYYHRRLPKSSIPNQVDGNHDQSRVVSRIGESAARAAAVHNLMLPGMRFIYNGRELGLTDGDIPEDRIKDTNGLRDPERTPIPWDSSQPNAGFSDANESDLWLPINKKDLGKSVVDQYNDPFSSLNLHRALLELCADSEVLQKGSYVPLKTDNKDVMGYGREFGGERIIVVTNFSDQEQEPLVIDAGVPRGKIVLSSLTIEQRRQEVDLGKKIKLAPNESIVVLQAKLTPGKSSTANQ